MCNPTIYTNVIRTHTQPLNAALQNDEPRQARIAEDPWVYLITQSQRSNLIQSTLIKLSLT